MSDLERISDQELRFCIALSAGKSTCQAAEAAGYTKRHGKNLLQRDTVKQAIIHMAVSLASVVVKTYGTAE